MDALRHMASVGRRLTAVLLLCPVVLARGCCACACVVDDLTCYDVYVRSAVWAIAAGKLGDKALAITMVGALAKAGGHGSSAADVYFICCV